ncbi:MAG: VWA domain-containing protein [Nitrospirales bacterium]|nr:VWA domain-containing protein [Nitrospirales bacterium]
MIVFAWPWLFFLIFLPWFLRWMIPHASQNQGAALKVPFFHELVDDPLRPADQHGLTVWKMRFWIGIGIWCVLLTAAARPEWVGEPIALPVSGRNLLMAVDISGSMKTPDFTIEGERVTRLTALKALGGQFISRRVGDRIRLIVFGSQAYLQTPLTFDRTTVQTMLNEAEIGMAGEKTAIGDALGLAVKRLNDQPDEEHVLVLLTDGSNTTGEITPLEATQLAQEAGIRIYTIGIGANRMEVSTVFGRRTVNPSRDLDEATLQSIASLTGGLYFRAQDTLELDHIYRQIDELEPLERESELLRPIEPLFMWPLGVAFILSILLALHLSGWTTNGKRLVFGKKQSSLKRPPFSMPSPSSLSKGKQPLT